MAVLARFFFLLLLLFWLVRAHYSVASVLCLWYWSATARLKLLEAPGAT